MIDLVAWVCERGVGMPSREFSRARFACCSTTCCPPMADRNQIAYRALRAHSREGIPTPSHEPGRERSRLVPLLEAAGSLEPARGCLRLRALVSRSWRDSFGGGDQVTSSEGNPQSLQLTVAA